MASKRKCFGGPLKGVHTTYLVIPLNIVFFFYIYRLLCVKFESTATENQFYINVYINAISIDL